MERLRERWGNTERECGRKRVRERQERRDRKRGKSRRCGLSHDYNQIRREVNCPAECENIIYVRGGDKKNVFVRCQCTCIQHRTVRYVPLTL